MEIEAVDILKKAQIVDILERVCQALELSASQYDLAKTRYEAVGDWLAGSANALLEDASIYPQGSVALGTTVKPLARNEHDVDIVCLVQGLGVDISPAMLKRVIGERLRESSHYNGILEEMSRCWRLSYANEFHLDITPSIRNPSCQAGGELVPDKRVEQWKPSNPKGYRKWFEERARLQPRMNLAKAALAEGQRADLQPFPTRMVLKGILRRTVQLAKRHRDVHFAKFQTDFRPISAIITTLAAKSYARCATGFEYDNELDLVRDVLGSMPLFIEERLVRGRKQWFVWNESTVGENFAEKWETDPRFAEAFFEWHRQAISDLERMVDVEGLDRLIKSLKESFGDVPVSKAMGVISEEVSDARRSGRLSVVTAVGLSIATGVGTKVGANTFFGRG